VIDRLAVAQRLTVAARVVDVVDAGGALVGMALLGRGAVVAAVVTTVAPEVVGATDGR
jgi:hypothetical protein